jgi:hypothetical protein
LVYEFDGLGQIAIMNPLPWWLAGAEEHLDLDPATLRAARRHWEVNAAGDGVERFTGETLDHFQYQFNRRMTAAGDHD